MVSFIQGGVFYSGVSFIQECLLFRGFFYSGVSFIQGCLLFRSVFYSGVSFIQGCPGHYRIAGKFRQSQG